MEQARVEFQEGTRLNKLKSDNQAAIFTNGMAMAKRGDLTAQSSASRGDQARSDGSRPLSAGYGIAGERQYWALLPSNAFELDDRLKPAGIN